MGVLGEPQDGKHQTCPVLSNGLTIITLARSVPGPAALPADPPLCAGQHQLQDLVLQVSPELCPLQGDVRPLLPGSSLCPDLHQQTRQLQSRLTDIHSIKPFLDVASIMDYDY